MEPIRIDKLIEEVNAELIDDCIYFGDPAPTDRQLSGEDLGFDLTEVAANHALPVKTLLEGQITNDIRDQITGKEFSVGMPVRIGEEEFSIIALHRLPYRDELHPAMHEASIGTGPVPVPEREFLRPGASLTQMDLVPMDYVIPRGGSKE